MMTSTNDTWAIVLAAGAGTRLSALTRSDDGAAVPKQFCSLTGNRTLLDEALCRAHAFAPSTRTMCVVASEHARWWSGLQSLLPDGQLVQQPRNRGTGIGIMLALAALARIDAGARVVLLPSDHFVRDERALAGSVAQALDGVSDEPSACVLIGITPEEVDCELGYIVPGAGTPLRRVSHFVEKPEFADAATLISAGALWNSFIMVGTVQGLLAMYVRRFAKLLAHMQRGLARDALRGSGRAGLPRLYARLPEVDFSRHVVPGNEERLRVLAAPACGWTDLGTPRRVARCLEALGARWIGPRAEVASTSAVNLALACRRLGLAR